MKIISKYVLKEHIGPFLFALMLITLLFLMNIIFRELGNILSRGLKIRTILEFLFLNIAWIIALAVPMAVLIATLMAFGRLSADNEITALKAGGVSFYRILTPVLIFFTGVGVLLVLFNDRVLPNFNHRARLLTADILRKRPTLKLEPNVIFKDIPKITLLVQNVKTADDSSKIYDVILDDRSSRDNFKTILAKWGSVHFDYRSERLILNLYDGEIHEITLGKLSEYMRVKFHKYRVSVDVPGLTLQRSNSQYRGDREKSVGMLLHDVKNLRKSISRERENLYRVGARPFQDVFAANLLAKSGASARPPAAATVLHPTKQDSAIVANEAVNLISQLKMEQHIVRSYYRSINALMVEVHKKYAIPAACIVFVLIGAPLGVMARKGNLGISGGISIVFFLIYWIFLIGGEELADRQFITPFWAMWSADILVGAAGVYLTIYSVHEYHPLELVNLLPKFLRKKQR
ncbi:putative permease YjgP/YjgQ family protein [bacterium BMS3Abin05]|nr:putative permease YjgP/YjgQ family protein [bacterium BMS3Abin05]GBE26308.1 putative permease YjgP/YjgQ family protein [bacterium BMS3Bbin03]HDK35800.1 YjgP/YjgQ family permease [Bacteroidota bacterium]HDL78704.1 YjgP/YjgQ family permease [Bacteroidota bacterium]HDZ11417.1 YjgP/YjgQ family permease [Bacteroidota bacterium]